MPASLNLPRRATQLYFLLLGSAFAAQLFSMTQSVAQAQNSFQRSTAEPETRATQDLYYGVYVGGQKMGFLRQQAQLAGQPTFSLDLQADLNAMGKLTSLHLSETRAYDANGLLLEIEFVQTAATGAMQVKVARAPEGPKYTMSILAGGQTRTTTLTIEETLADHLRAQTLAQTGKIGSKATAHQFDPSLQRTNQVHYQVMALKTRNIDGVATPCVQLLTRYPELEIEETAWFDRQGRVLESRIGGHFVARLEPRAQAMTRHITSDVLVGSTVRAPAPLPRPATLKRLTLSLAGVGNQTLPETPWQKVAYLPGPASTVSLVRTQPLWPTPQAIARADKREIAHPSADRAEALRATAFIQSDAKVLIEAARDATHGCTSIQSKSAALVQFVSRHLKSEYVPAFSNALEAFESKRGDCTEHSVLFAALARAVGIPARPVVGVAYWAPGHGYGWHAWDEIYVGGVWLPVDPTWRQNIADVTHIKLAEGDAAAQARVVMLLGRLRVLAQSYE